MHARKINTLEKIAKKWELERFPDKFEVGMSESIYAPPNRQYFYFGPFYHIESGLVNQEVIDDLNNSNKTLLSVGSGAAFLERFLVEKIGIDQSRIALSDLYKNDLPKQFRKYQFDMDEEWPELGEKFDYIIFPESVNCNVKFDGDTANQVALNHYITNAYHNLKKIGQIRINGHCQPEERISAVRKKLEKTHSDLDMISTSNLIIVKKGYKNNSS